MDPPLRTPVSGTDDSILSAEASFQSAPSSPEPPLVRTPTGNPLLGTREPNLLMPTVRTVIVDQQAETAAQGGHFRTVNEPRPSVSGSLPPLLEVPVNFNIPAIQSTIRGKPLPRDCEWFFVSVGRVLILISTLSSPGLLRKFGPTPPDARFPDK